MKKVLTLFLAIILCFSIVACGDESSSDNPSGGNNETVEKQPSTDESLDMTTGEKNALKSAKSYIDYGDFSYKGLIKQLLFEEYTEDEAKFGADNCGADWKKEAIESAESYIDYGGFSYKGLIKQLEYEEFTSEEAKYGADNCGANWKEEAAETAKSYLDYSSFSRTELIGQLEYEGFTSDEIDYALAEVGY